MIRGALVLAALLPMWAQVAPPGPSGVGLGHLHLHSADVEAQAKFWIENFGAVPTKVGDLTLYKLPGVFIAINAEKPRAGMEGSTVPLIGLKAKAAAEHVLEGPDRIRVQASAGPVIHLDVPDPEVAEQWYKRTFGEITGVRLVFSKSAATPEGTKGRALDHIGFEVRDLHEFTKKLAATGQKVDLMYYKLPDSGVAIAFVTDPFGTSIELTEGLVRF